MGGIPVFVGTRVPVKTLLDHLVDSPGMDEFLDDFPGVSREQAVRFLEEAAKAYVGGPIWYSDDE
jgi:uncharacterized protein (DUF433 family)